MYQSGKELTTKTRHNNQENIIQKFKDTKASLHKHLYACKRFNSANEFFSFKDFFRIFTSKQLSRLRITLCLLIMTEKKGENCL
jgi:hypothetical protein